MDLRSGRRDLPSFLQAGGSIRSYGRAALVPNRILLSLLGGPQKWVNEELG